MSALAELKDRFAGALTGLTDDLQASLSMIRPAQDPKFGDYQANCAMPLARTLGRSPREIAADIVHRLDVDDLCEPPEIAGPGFINLRLKDDWIQAAAQQMITDERLGHTPVTSKTHVIDYSSPNVAKPTHVGHLRSSVIGSALVNILRFAGHRVISDNHIGDWGTQFGMIIYGYRAFVDQAAYDRDPVSELARLYRLVNQLSEYHAAVAGLPQVQARIEASATAISETEAGDLAPKEKKQALRKLRSAHQELTASATALADKIDIVTASPDLTSLAAQHSDIATLARAETAKLHAGDESNHALWKKFLPECLKTLQVVYDKLDVEFDQTLGESFYQPMLDGVVSDLKQSGLATDSDGAVCIFIEGNDAPFIIRKTDGAFTYGTTDLATVKYRAEEFDADVMLYVVDTRQSEHFHLLFQAARQWGYDNVEFRHINFGTVLGSDKRPFKTRSGDTVGLEGLLDEAVARAYRIVCANDDAKPEDRGGPELDDQERQRVAEAVGIGGIKYADLHHNRESDYVFDWDKMLATTGDTAAYIQYANARIHGIFRKADVDRDALRADHSTIRITHPSERALIIHLQAFADVIDAVVREMKPNLLTQFLFETANRFTGFYSHCNVAREEDAAIRTSRLILCDLACRTLSRGLTMLGIQSPQKM